MPIYEYKCKKCGTVFEELVRNSSETPSCPDCDSKDVARQMSAPATQHGESSATPCGSDCGGEHAHSCGCGGCCHCH